MVSRNTIVGIDFFVIGLVIIALGYIGAQSIPIASFGLAVTIIGALLLLVVPEPIPQDAYATLLKDATANIEIILEESQLRERAYFMSVDDEVRAFIPIPLASESVQYSQRTLQEIAKFPKRFITNYHGLVGLTLIPPGNELVKLSGVQRGDEVEEALRNVIVGSSDLASSILSFEEGNSVKIQIKNPKVTSESPYFNDCLGSPLSCIGCCVVSVVEGKPVRIADEKFDRALIRLSIEIME